MDGVGHSGCRCVGLTGGIGCGKTTVSNEFARLGVPVFDADVISKSLTQPGQPALRQIIAAFGDDFLLPGGGLDRARLRRHILQLPAARQQLEAILHPLAWQEIWGKVAASDAPYCIASVPLLVESSHAASMDRIVVVDCAESLQRQRLASRDQLSAEEIEAFLRAQADRKTRLAYADDVIHNDSDLSSLRSQVVRLHQSYLAWSSLPGRERKMLSNSKG
jgi:dephospho-CoA kinase